MRCVPGLVCGVLLAAAGCGAPGDLSSLDQQLSSEDAVARAEQWVAVSLKYCQAPNHGRDDDDACSTYCNRYSNPAWDPYRSDCSGLVSWAWGLAAPGRTTYQFAPFVNDLSSAIPAGSLRAGDAVNNADHIMLFKEWLVNGQRAVFIEEPGCATAITYAHELTSNVSINGSSIYVAAHGTSFTAIRYRGFGGGSGGGATCLAGGLYCGGDKLSGDPNTLYRCDGAGAPTVVQHCADGCNVVPGQDDACGTSSSGGDSSGGSCVAGGLYCGGDKIGGDAGTLYRCNGAGAPSVVAHCAAGCQVMSGADDQCHGAGGCVAGGLYCGGDKVSGNPNELYRCGGGSSGTAVQSCAAGCVVLSGRNDACK
jgi:hypothetical protein